MQQRCAQNCTKNAPSVHSSLVAWKVGSRSLWEVAPFPASVLPPLHLCHLGNLGLRCTDSFPQTRRVPFLGQAVRKHDECIYLQESLSGRSSESASISGAAEAGGWTFKIEESPFSFSSLLLYFLFLLFGIVPVALLPFILAFFLSFLLCHFISSFL